MSAWEKCPACLGAERGLTNGVNYKCTVCNGMKIIHSVTGKPPHSKSEMRRLEVQASDKSKINFETNEEIKNENTTTNPNDQLLSTRSSSSTFDTRTGR